MSRICVITSNGAAYYAIVSKLRAAGFPFLSLLPSDDVVECGLVVTTRREAASINSPTVALEELDEDPTVVRGQVISRMTSGGQMLLVGIDPGSRIGAAAFLDETMLGSRTFNSGRSALAWVASVAERVPSNRAVVRVGDGDPKTANWLADALASRIPGALVEIVDESGTSQRKAMKGLQRDQGSAAKIALRKGRLFRQQAHASRSR